MADISSSQRLNLERGPRLRRLAERVELQAESSADPDRARELAREMRIRAAELEGGHGPAFDLEDVDEEFDNLAFHESAPPPKWQRANGALPAGLDGGAG